MKTIGLPWVAHKKNRPFKEAIRFQVAAVARPRIQPDYYKVALILSEFSTLW